MELDTDRLFARARPIAIGKTRRLLWLLLLMVVSFVWWANVAVLDEQVRAKAVLIVSSRSQLVQVVDGGTLKALHVQEGQLVKQGDLLAEMDHVRFEASSEEFRSKVLNFEANIARLNAELSGEEIVFSETVLSDRNLAQNQQELHFQRLRQQKQERSATEESLTLAEEELSLLNNLSRTGDAPYADILKLRRQIVEMRSGLNNRENEVRREAQAKLSDSQSQLDQAIQVLKQREEALSATFIAAPMSGTVKNVNVTTLGAVLNPGAELLQIVPSDDPILIEARVLSGNVAFLRAGLETNIKLDAYDFTVYGSLRGVVDYVSPDTIDADLAANEEPYYRVLISIESIPDRLSKREIVLIPGMTGAVEIITGMRTVAQYIMKPLRRGSAAALTEP
jgi:adhesin transport system membrane fusion protein